MAWLVYYFFLSDGWLFTFGVGVVVFGLDVADLMDHKMHLLFFAVDTFFLLRFYFFFFLKLGWLLLDEG